MDLWLFLSLCGALLSPLAAGKITNSKIAVGETIRMSATVGNFFRSAISSVFCIALKKGPKFCSLNSLIKITLHNFIYLAVPEGVWEICSDSEPIKFV